MSPEQALGEELDSHCAETYFNSNSQSGSLNASPVLDGGIGLKKLEGHGISIAASVGAAAPSSILNVAIIAQGEWIDDNHSAMIMVASAARSKRGMTRWHRIP
jgi:hypothetical protein